MSDKLELYDNLQATCAQAMCLVEHKFICLACLSCSAILQATRVSPSCGSVEERNYIDQAAFGLC